MNIRPMHDRVLVRRQESAHQTASGIVIPDAASEVPDQGEVIAVGPGQVMNDGEVRALDVKVGDTVLFGKFAGQSVKVGGQAVKVGTDELLVMREADIIAVL